MGAGGTLPRDPGAFGPVRVGGYCRLGIAGSAPDCACEALDARARLALGLPVPLDALGSADLELLDGIGPVRARAIAEERARGGAFGSSEALARRVPGIGPVGAARISRQLAGHPAGACNSTAGVPDGTLPASKRISS